MIYNHTQPTRFTTTQCADAVGKRATLHLTGTITEQRVSDAGPFVMFDVDERWGLGNVRLGFDLDALEVSEPPLFPSPEYDRAHGIDLQRSASIGRGDL